jgi:hypothetical protein
VVTWESKIILHKIDVQNRKQECMQVYADTLGITDFPMVQRSGGGSFQEETEMNNPFNQGEN